MEIEIPLVERIGETMGKKKYRSISHGRYGNQKRAEQVRSYSTLKRVGDGLVDIDAASLFPRDQSSLLQQNSSEAMHIDYRDIGEIIKFINPSKLFRLFPGEPHKLVM